MKAIIKKYIVSSIFSAAVFLATGSVYGKQIKGTLSAYNHSAYAGTASHFHIDNLKVDGVEFFGGEANIFCGDFSARSLDNDSHVYPRPVTLTLGKIEQMNIWDRYRTKQDEALAIAQISWLFDNHYDSHFINPGNDVHEKQYAFQNVIWEVMGDGGTAAGLNFKTGNINRKSLKKHSKLWNEMNDLLDAVRNSGVDGNYEGRFDIYAALDSRRNYQDYFFVANKAPTPVPEPSAVLFAMVGLGFLVRRRR